MGERGEREMWEGDEERGGSEAGGRGGNENGETGGNENRETGGNENRERVGTDDEWVRLLRPKGLLGLVGWDEWIWTEDSQGRTITAEDE